MSETTFQNELIIKRREKGGVEVDEKIGSWIKEHPSNFQKIVASVIFLFGICLMIGAIRDWSWLYAPDKEYHYKWSLGKVSRYCGRKTARVIGFIGRIFFAICGGMLIYGAFLT